MRVMADLLRRKHAPAKIMQLYTIEDAQQEMMFADVKRYDPRPCSNGRKFKQCHGKLNLAN